MVAVSNKGGKGATFWSDGTRMILTAPSPARPVGWIVAQNSGYWSKV
jgi:hypothetical protein